MPQPILIEFTTDLTAVEKAIDSLEQLGLVDKKTADEFRKTSAQVKEHNANLQKTGQTADAVKIDIQEMVTAIKEIPKKIIDDSAKKSLDDAGKATEEVTTKSTRLAMQLRKIKEEMNQLELAGKTNTARYRELAMTAGKYEDQIGDTAARVKVLASDTRNLDAALSLATGVAGGFSVAQGAAGLFGDENEDLQKTMLKVQSALALVNGLTAVSQTLNKDSAASVVLLGGAQRAYTIIVGESTGAVRLFRIALASIAFIAIAAGIYAGVKALGEWISGLKEATVAMDGANISRETYVELQNKINEGTVDEKTKLSALLAIAKDNNISLADRNRAVKEINELSPKYLGTLDLATIAQGKETAAVNAYIEALDRKVKARALEEILVTKQKELYEKENASIYDGVTLLGQAWDLVKAMFGNKDVLRDRADDQREATNDLRNEIDELTKAYNEVNKEILLAGDSVDLFTQKTEATVTAVREAKSDPEAISPIPGPKYLETNIIEPSIKVIENFEEKLQELERQTQERIREEIQETREARLAAYQEAQSIAMQGLDAIGALEHMASQNAQTELDEQLAKKVISQEQYDKKTAEQKRKTAIQEKTLNVFKALLNIPAAILEGLVRGGIPLSILFGAIATAEAAAIIGTKIPAFKRGREGEEALKGGRPYQDSILAMLAPGERVVTAEVNQEYYPILSKIHNRQIPAGLLNTLAEMPSFAQIAAGLGGGAIVLGPGATDIDYKRMGQAVGNEIAKLPLTSYHWDMHGIYRTITNGTTRVKYYEDRYSSN